MLKSGCARALCWWMWVCGLSMGTASAQSSAEGEYLGLSFTGDGTTPSATQLFEAMDRSTAAPRGGADASDKGDVSYSVPVAIPSALHQSTPGTVAIDFDVVSDLFTAQSGGITSELAPRSDIDFDGLGVEPRTWNVLHSEDRSGNAIDYVWEGPRLV